MQNQQLVDYIKQATEHGQSKDQIKQALLQAGWQEKDIEEALGGNVSNIPTPQSMQSDAPPVFKQSPGDVRTGVTQIKYAGFWIRWAAGFIDGIVIGVVNFAFGIIIGIIVATLGGSKETADAWRAIGALTGFIYFVVMTKKYQVTLGKKAAGIQVISEKAGELSWSQVILREVVGKIISTLILGIGYLIAGFTDKKQALHDKVAGTVVVYKDPNKKVSIFIYIAAAIIPILAIGGFIASVVLVSLNTAREKGMDARKIADIRSVQLSLETYYDVNGRYPVQAKAGDLSGIAGDLATYAQGGKLPCDPGVSPEKCGASGGNGYIYYSSDDGKSYHIGVALKNSAHTQLSGDDDSEIGFSGVDTKNCGISVTTDGVACYDLVSR